MHPITDLRLKRLMQPYPKPENGPKKRCCKCKTDKYIPEFRQRVDDPARRVNMCRECEGNEVKARNK